MNVQMKPMTENSDEYRENGDLPENNSDYYYPGEYAEPQMDEFDAKLLGRFLKMLKDSSDSNDVNYDDQLPEADDTARPRNASSGTHCQSLAVPWQYNWVTASCGFTTYEICRDYNLLFPYLLSLVVDYNRYCGLTTPPYRNYIRRLDCLYLNILFFLFCTTYSGFSVFTEMN